MDDSTVLEIRDLRTHFRSGGEVVAAVDGVDLSIRRGQTVGLVGESGCGKSVTSLSVMRLVPRPGRIVGGQVLFHGADVMGLPDREVQALRGDRISMIFQEPMTSLNPVQRVGDQIAEALLVHRKAAPADVKDAVCAMLSLVGMAQPELRYAAYPHEMSGGMRQRVMIAMALACRPELLIADEPTTALDVTIQAQILELIKDLRDRSGMAVLLITHDLGVIAEMAEDVAVMYAGRIVEHADVATLFRRPLHPYTQGLLASIPTVATPKGDRLHVIPGSVPNLARLPRGCHFAPRCPHATPRCREARPALGEVGRTRVACWLHYGAAGPQEGSADGR